MLSWLAFSAGLFAADYSRDIKPLFAERCLECHGPDDQKGGVRLDQEDEDTLASISAGELMHRITTDDPDERMPPEGPGLSPEQVQAVKTWVKNGAPFERHWAYRPLSSAAPPEVGDASWIRNPIDRFVLAMLEEKSIKPSPEADRTTLLKRLHYDLIGLPPTPEEVQACLADSSTAAYEKVVDRLLASPHFGERWGRHWLDKARYADSDGYEKDRPRPQAWRYRDWVIDAINNDMPFDRFTIEQLAGDLLPNPTREQKLATAFHRQTLTNTEGGTDKEQFRTEAVFDRTETTGSIWLGLTVGCARCHTHKYDAISMREYYQLYAFFNDGDESTMKVVTSEAAMEKYRKDKAAYDEKRAALDREIGKVRAAGKAAFEQWKTSAVQLAEGADTASFHLLSDVEVKASRAGFNFEKLSDGSFFVDQYKKGTPAPVQYVVNSDSVELSQPVTALQLEALSDPRLGGKGPGLVAHGNFVVGEIELLVNGKQIAFESAKASYSQNNFSVSALIDGKHEERNGWAISGQMGKNHQALLYLEKPLPIAKSDQVEIRIIHNYGQDHYLGRFRVRLMTGRENQLPADLLTILQTPIESWSDKQKSKVAGHFYSKEYPATKKLYREKEQLAKSAPKEPAVNVRVISAGDRDTHILERGDFLSPGEKVSFGGLSVLPPIQGRSKEGPGDRLDLANWLMSDGNPLPPRVLANHVWTHLFGAGLVRTNNDFGVRGEMPTHPQLLDWLAAEFRRLDWSRKALIRTIVTSSTYRQSSKHRPELIEIDANNRWLARQNRFRVEAEILRDISLSLAGLLSTEIGGPSVFPPLPPSIADLSYANNFKWKTSEGGNRYRRGLYTFFKRTSPHPNLTAFDCPDANTTSIVRRTSNTPIQALTMLNNEVFVEASRALAKRFLELDVASEQERIEQALAICLYRQPNSSEIEPFRRLLNQSREYYTSHPEQAARLVGANHLEAMPKPEAAAWTAFARIALNLDEVITRE